VREQVLTISGRSRCI